MTHHDTTPCSPKVGLARKLVRKPGYARAHGQPFEAWPREGHASPRRRIRPLLTVVVEAAMMFVVPFDVGTDVVVLPLRRGRARTPCGSARR